MVLPTECAEGFIPLLRLFLKRADFGSAIIRLGNGFGAADRN